jgi:general secretion pathway protein D
VYYLENATAEDLAKVLKDIPTKQAGGAATPQGGKKEAPVISDSVKIAADKATNSLIITADKEDYVVLEEIIRKLDIPRAMVYIESLIMEVNIDKDFRLGTEWIGGGKTSLDGKDAVVGTGFSGGATGGDAGYSAVNPSASIASSLTGSSTTTTSAVLPPGVALGIFTKALTIGNITFPNLSAVVQLYKKDKDVHILSTPQVLTTDNQEAKITVGRNIPFQTRSGVTSTTTTTSTLSDYGNYNSYEYKDVGKTLKITPQISKDRMVRLVISLEVTDLESTTDFRPTTLKRAVDTTVVIKDGETVVIGGLIDDKFSSTEYKVPCLGDIPGVNLLFSSIGKGNVKTNLYVFLTPHVMKNPEEAKKLYLDKRNEIDKADDGGIKLYKKSGDAPEHREPELLN